MRLQTFVRQGQRVAIAACGLLMGAWSMQSCKDDVLEGQPSWLGNSIYERLQEDTEGYTTLLRLIDDLGYREELSQTGSKTLFAANDSAFSAWFKKKGLTYETLSEAQKKMLLKNSMVDQAYLIELLSNIASSGTDRPTTGECLRRESSASQYDSVPLLQVADMPLTPGWAAARADGKPLLVMKDDSKAPMLHFLPAFMRKHHITDNDLQVLSNGQSNSVNDSWIAGQKVTEADITCKNGYIHKVAGVIESSPNMAEIIHQHPDMSKWAGILDRYSAPYTNSAASENYNRLYHFSDGIAEQVYALRYWSDASGQPWGRNNTGTVVQVVMPDGTAVGSTSRLKFDPGWNVYTQSTSYASDAGVMIVPTNKALDEWWETGTGRALKEQYQHLDSVTLSTMAELVNVNMLGSLVESVPSKFESVLDDAKLPLGITAADVDSCFMGCNGVVYMVNKVFTPSSYASVLFPAMINEGLMKTIYEAVSAYNFKPYLNSMESTYTFFVPSNQAMLSYLDPLTFGQVEQRLYEFYFDEEETKALAGKVYKVTLDADHNIVSKELERKAEDAEVENRLTDLLNTSIVLGDVTDGHEYYKTMGGSVLRVQNAGSASTMTISGGHQNEIGQPLHVSKEFRQQNGNTYLIDDGVPLTAQRAVYNVLEEQGGEGGPFEAFFQLMQPNKLNDPSASDDDDDTTGGSSSSSASGSDDDDDDDPADVTVTVPDKYTFFSNVYSTATPYTALSDAYNMKLFSNYNYTVYVPTNAAVRAMQTAGYLPTWDDYRNADVETWGSEAARDTARTVIAERINNFVRYHIQDNALYVGGQPVLNTQGRVDSLNGRPAPNRYETAMQNPQTRRFYSLSVSYDDNSMIITDQLGNVRNVATANAALYNQICREYWIQTAKTTSRVEYEKIYVANDAVVHQIDNVLLYAASQQTPWRDEVQQRIHKARRK